MEGARIAGSSVLYVGVGGTGKEIVSLVKAKLKALGGGEVSPRVGFLAIDVDPRPSRAPELQSVLSQDELCHPSQGFLPSHAQAEVRKQIKLDGELAWVGERIPPGEMTLEYSNFMKGTERYRQVGLLAYLWEEHSVAGVSGALRLAIAGVTQAVRAPTALSVFIVGSLCGGFGSGALVDVAYLARSIGLEYAAGSCDVSAVLVLPGVFRRYVDDATYNDLQRNALAALTELDYFMYPREQRLARTCDPSDLDWPLRSAAGGGYTLDTERPVFDSVFVVDNQRNNGGTVGGPEVVFPAVADMLAHLSGDLIGDRFLEALNNAKSTLKRGFTQQDRLGKDMPHYSSLGLARIVLPVRRMAIEAASVLSGDILTKLRGGAEKPSEAAVADAVRRLELEPAAMAQALGLARDEFIAGLAKAIDLRAPGAAGGRIAVVSHRVAGLVRQKAPPDATRRYCLDTLGKARRSVIATQDQAQRRLSRRLTGSAESMNKVLSEPLTRMREAGRGLTWFLSLLGEVIEATDKNLARARQASARDPSDTAVQAEQEFQKAWDRLGNCPPGGVRQAAQAAATKCDDWLGKRVDLVTARMQDLVLDDSLSKLRKIAEAAKSLAIFLGETLPAETDRAVGALCKKEEDEAAVTDIRVAADGRKEYESAKNAAAREKMTADCLKDLTVELREGDLRLLCSDGRRPELLLIGPSLQPLEAAQDWIEYLANRLKPHFASHRLDDYIATDDAACRYANACAKEAEVFVKYSPTLQLAVAGDPITIDVVVATADSRLHAAFSRSDTAWRGQLQGVVCAQDSDPTSALVFKAETGILGDALQFRKDAAALEASMVSMPGLWTLGPLSHSIFWRDPDRWENLRLLFLGVAAGRILRNPAPMDFGAKGHVRHVYSMNIGHGQTSSLGVGLQKAILEFLSPNSVTNRSALANWVNAPETQEVVRVVLPEVKREYAELAQQPEEVPSAPLRTVLALRLRDLEV
jgi:hypothetical protein